MIKGFNKADPGQARKWAYVANNTKELEKRPCVFLSHKKEDKPECRVIAGYLSNAEIDYYLDELDDALQQAAAAENPLLITESIKKGIRESSHMMVVVSEKTRKSHWVPFEVGYGHAAIIDKSMGKNTHADRIKLSILTLIDIAEKELPDYMQVGYIIRGTKSLNEYIVKITNQYEASMINKGLLLRPDIGVHPLDSVLNWRL